ncbi:MAG: hypothetical protein PVI75_04385 [Gammaproteobacteria bacterium]|jgi:hypothetical protein
MKILIILREFKAKNILRLFALLTLIFLLTGCASPIYRVDNSSPKATLTIIPLAEDSDYVQMFTYETPYNCSGQRKIVMKTNKKNIAMPTTIKISANKNFVLGAVLGTIYRGCDLYIQFKPKANARYIAEYKDTGKTGRVSLFRIIGNKKYPVPIIPRKSRNALIGGETSSYCKPL